MIKRFIRLSAIVAFSGLTLALAHPSVLKAADSGPDPIKPRIAQDADTKPKQTGDHQVPAASSPTKKKKKHAQYRKRRSKRFVRLSRRILDDTLICRDEFEFIGTILDPHLNGCLATDQNLKWAFAPDEETPIAFTEHPFAEPEDDLAGSPQLAIQPLEVYWVGSTIFFTPLAKAVSLNVEAFSQGSEAWLLDHDWASESKSGTAFDHLFVGDTSGESAPISYRYNMDQNSAFIAGVGYIYDIADTTGMSQAFAMAGYDTSEKVGAVNLTLGYSYNAFTLTGGYIHAIENRESLAVFSASDQNNDPTAWSSQLAYSTRFLNRPTVFAVGYQKSSETLGHYLPEERYTTKASILLRGKTTLSLEYYQDREYSGVDDLGDDDAYGITTKLGFQF